MREGEKSWDSERRREVREIVRRREGVKIEIERVREVRERKKERSVFLQVFNNFFLNLK